MLAKPKKKESVKAEKCDYIPLVATLILAIVVTECTWFGGFGVGFVLTVAVYMACYFGVCKVIGKKQTKASKYLMVPILLTAGCFLLFSNNLLKFFNFIFMMGLLLIQAVEVFGLANAKIFEAGWWKQVASYSVLLPICNIDKPMMFAKEEVGEANRSKFKEVGKIAIGILVALPILFVVTALLCSADAAFAQVVTLLSEKLGNIEMTWLVKRLVVTGIGFGVLFSYFYGLVHDNIGSFKAERVGSTDNKPATLDFTIIATVTSLICIVYMVYCGSQLVYLVSAFRGILPEGYSSAEYARRGFFETLPIVGVNLVLIMVLGKLAGESDTGKKKKYAYGNILFISAFAMFMTICALSKMGLYMSRYGLTLRRVYVAWFLVLLIIVLVLMVIRSFKTNWHMTKVLFVLFTIMYLGLNYANVDYAIASYNVKLYEAGVVDNFSACIDLSSSGMIPLKKYIVEKEDPSKEDINWIRHRYKAVKNRTQWQRWNLSDHLARQAE